MFFLLDQRNNPALMSGGAPFVYTSRVLALLGKKVLEASFSGKDGTDPSRVFRVAER